MSTRAWLVLGLAVTLVLIILPLGLTSYQVGLATKMLILALFAMSLDLLLGYAGLPSLGHAAFFGVGAYIAGLLTLRAGLNPWLAFPAGLLAATLTGALYGLFALRARGTYFLMITLALAQVMWGIAFGWRSMTGGDDGLPNVPRPVLALPWSLADTLPFYYFTLLVVGVATILLVCIVRSPFGHALRGIRESESRMLALGYNAWRYKYLAFVLSSVFAGLSGCLYVYFNRFVSPDYLHVVRSAEVLLMVILGGAGTLIGPALGAALITLLENVISNYTQRWLLVLGGIYVVVTLFAPRGLLGLADAYRRRRFGE
jgi:branched-chain amino acid transport system permease protein